MANIGFLGDTHGNTRFTIEAIKEAHNRNCETILQLGDFGIWDHIPAGVRFLDDVDAELEKREMKLIFCDGNHECFDRLYDDDIYPVSDDGFRRVRKNIWHAPRGHIWEMGGVTFMAMGGAHSIDGPKGAWPQGRGPGYDRIHGLFDLGAWWPQETIKVDEAQQAIERALDWKETNGNIDVLISHDCPAGVSIPNIHGYPAGNSNRELLAQVCDAADPNYIFCGHYHRRYTSNYYNGATVEILASDANNEEQLLIVSTEKLKEL